METDIYHDLGHRRRNTDKRRKQIPLPKQDEMPLEKAPDNLHAWMRLQETINVDIASDLQALRDEIQRLKDDK
jgi:hypothetical protein